MDDEYHRAFGWSPDGRTLVASVVTGEQGHGGEFRVYRADRPAETEPTPDDLRAHADAADPRDRAFLLALLAERERTPYTNPDS